MAAGSCLTRFGDTQVLCTASLEDRVPPHVYGTGAGWVTAEYGMLPRSTHERMAREAARGKQGGRTLEIQRLIGRALRAAVDLKALGLMAHADGASFREGAEDLLIVTEAVAVTLVLMQVAKFTTARTRPDAWAGSGSVTANSRMSFFAGHSAVAFAVAASGTQVLRLRGRTGWGWFAAATFVGSAASGWFRVASDNHWLTDVVAGAAIGTAVGFALPGLVLHPATAHAPAVTLAPAAGGVALRF